MKTLFADIYNRIRDLFQFEKSENTSECAANRLQVILMHDRTKLDPLIMNKMREELIEVFSKYVVINKDELEIGLKNEGDAAALMLNIPIVRAKTEEELNELRKKLQEEEEKVSDDEDDENNEDNEASESSSYEDKKEENIVEGEVTSIEVESSIEPETEEENQTENTESSYIQQFDNNTIIEENKEKE